MPARPLITRLEQEILFPVLNAIPADFPHAPTPLASLQAALIDTFRIYYYPCTTKSALHHALALSLLRPPLGSLWTDLKSLGFSTPNETMSPAIFSI